MTPTPGTTRGLATGSLRIRVAAVVLGLMAVTLIGLGLFVHAMLGVKLRADLEARLTDRAALAEGLDGQLSGQQLADRLSGAGVVATVGTGSDTAVGRATVTPPSPPAGLSGPGRRPAPGAGPPPAPGGRGAGTPTIQRDGAVLSIREQLPHAGPVTLSVSEADVQDTLHRLAAVEAVGSLAVLLIMGLLLTRLVGVALRPLTRMTALARSTAGGQRGGRLRPTKPRTELGQTAAAFDAMLDELERAAATATAAEDRLREFLGYAGHELRTPIAGLQIAAETLLTQAPDRAEREALAVGAVRSARRAGRLVDDLIVMARAGELPLASEPVDLAAVAQDSLHRARLLAPEISWSLRSAEGAGVDGDPTRLAQIVDNLLDNARRATAPGGSVAVTLLLAADQVSLTIADTGPGISPAERERVFERFVRLDPGSYPGSGLGLPLARMLARAHGGDVTLLDSDRGAVFALTLPSAGSGPGHLAVGPRGDRQLSAASSAASTPSTKPRA